MTPQTVADSTRKLPMRKRKLIDNRLQLKLSFWLMGVATIAMFFQFAILGIAMSEIGPELPNDSQVFHDRLFEQLFRSFLASLAMALSLTFVAGVLLSHRVAGPVYRFLHFLQAVERGEESGECQIRRNDELQELCSAINSVTRPLRERTAGDGDGVSDDTARAA